MNDTQDLKEITEILINLYNLDKHNLFYNFLSFESIYDLIYEYVEVFYVLNIRQQYVYSKTYFYSRITNKSNLKYDINWTKIKEAFKNKNYAIYDFFIEMLDEATDEISAGKNWEDIKDESGAREYRRKYGHIHRERNYMILSKQDNSDEVARFRRITPTNILLDQKVKIINTYKISTKIINFIFKIIYKYNYFKLNLKAIMKGHIFYEARLSYIEEEMKSNKIFGKKINYILTTIKNFIFSQSYCKFSTRIYNNEDDVGKENTSSKIFYDDFNFIIPLRYCFGCFNTHEFAYVQKQLINNSNIKFEDLEKDLMFLENEDYFNNDRTINLGGGLIYD